MNDDINNIRINLQRWKTYHEYSWTYIRRGIDWEQSSLSNFMSGQRSIPLKRAIQLARFMEITVDQLIQPNSFDLWGCKPRKDES